MADNTELSAGSGGDTIATDDIAGIKHQRVKLQYGVDGSATDVSVTNPLPIDDAGGSLTVDGTVTANLGTVDNAVIDAIQVATEATQAAVEGTLTVGAHAVTNAGTFAVQESGDALTALQLIDDAVHTDDAAFTLGTSKGVVVMGFAGTQSVNANDAAALACDTDGALHIADGGNSITVDGSVTANAGTNLNTSALALEGGGNLATLAGAVAGSEMQVDVVTSALPSGAATASNQTTIIGHVDGIETVLGTIDTDTGNIATSTASAATNTAKGASHYRNVDANAEAAIKAGAGTLHWVHAMNMTAAVAYLHLYDATTANVTPGSTTPNYTFPLPTQGDTNGAGFTLRLEQAFANAITLVVTTTIDGSAGDPGTNGVFVNAGYT